MGTADNAFLAGMIRKQIADSENVRRLRSLPAFTVDSEILEKLQILLEQPGRVETAHLRAVDSGR